jgi:hypothetical protein
LILGHDALDGPAKSPVVCPMLVNGRCAYVLVSFTVAGKPLPEATLVEDGGLARPT